MKRPRAHEVNDTGRAQLMATLGPEWSLNETKSDYGIDFDVEIFSSGQSTGLTFKLQLKSAEACTYSVDGTFVSVRLKLKSARYLATELLVPTILVYADVRGRRTFWHAPQLDGDLIRRLSAAVRGSLSVRIPISQELPATKGEMQAAVMNASIRISTRAIASAPIPVFMDSAPTGDPSGQLIGGLDEKADLLRIAEAHALVLAGNVNEAKKHLHRLADPSATPTVKLNALLLREQIGMLELARAHSSPTRQTAFAIEIAQEALQSFRRGPKPQKFFALIMARAAEFDATVDHDATLWAAWAHARQLDDAFWDVQLMAARAASAKRINMSYRRCVRLLTCALRTSYRGMLAEPLLRIPSAFGPWLLTLRKDGLSSQAHQVESAALRMCQVCAQLASENGDANLVARAAHVAFMTSDLDAASPSVVWARDVLARLSEPLRQHTEQLFERAERRLRGERLVEEGPTPYREMYEDLAAVLGIDLADETDMVASVVRVGIADFDPSRVLKDCESLHVHPLTVGLPGQRLGLPTAGSKLIYCERHGHTMGGFRLDEIYGSFMGFRPTFCDKCADKRPRPADWTWSPSYQKAAERRYEESHRLHSKTSSED